MLCSAKFSMTLQTGILSIETSDLLKQIFFFKSFNSVFDNFVSIVMQLSYYSENDTICFQRFEPTG